MAEVDPLGPAILDGIAALSIEDVRARRSACQALETELSYVRRLCQGRLDIVTHELAHRGRATAEPADVVAELTEALADHVVAPGVGHLPTGMAPGDVDPALLGGLDEAAPPGPLSDPHHLDKADLLAYAERLDSFERELSRRRRAMFDRIDALQEEIVRRYREGEASVDSLLGS